MILAKDDAINPIELDSPPIKKILIISSIEVRIEIFWLQEIIRDSSTRRSGIEINILNGFSPFPHNKSKKRLYKYCIP